MDRWEKVLGTTLLAGGVAYVLYRQYAQRNDDSATTPAEEEEEEDWVIVDPPTELQRSASIPHLQCLSSFSVAACLVLSVC